MTSGHFIFIPAIFAFGLLCGFLLGGRVAQDRLNLERKRDAEREAARKARAERKAESESQEKSGVGPVP